MYRQVLVRISTVTVIDKTNLPSCNWSIQNTVSGSPILIVNDDMMFVSTSCPARAALPSTLHSVTGFSTWSNSANQTQLAPRGSADIQP
jgi:hypothetical protein